MLERPSNQVENPQGTTENEQSSIALVTLSKKLTSNIASKEPTSDTPSEEPRLDTVSTKPNIDITQETRIYFHPHALDIVLPNGKEGDTNYLKVRIALAIKALKQSTTADTYFYVTHVNTDSGSTHLIHGLECEASDSSEAKAQQYMGVSLPESATNDNDEMTIEAVKSDTLPLAFHQNNIESCFSEGKIIVTPPSPPSVQSAEKFAINRNYNHDEAGLLFEKLNIFIDELVSRKNAIDSTSRTLAEQEQNITSLKKEWLKTCEKTPELSEYINKQCQERQDEIQANLGRLIKEKDAINNFLASIKVDEPKEEVESKEELDSFIDLDKSSAEFYIEFKNNKEALDYKKRLIAWALQKTAADYFLTLQKDSLNNPALRQDKIKKFEKRFKDVVKLENGNLAYCEDFVEKYVSYSLVQIVDEISIFYKKFNTGFTTSDKQTILVETFNDISQHTGLTLSHPSFFTQFQAIFDEATMLQESSTNGDILEQVGERIGKEIEATKEAALVTNLEEMIVQTVDANQIVIEGIKLNIELWKLKQSIEETKNSIASLREAMPDTQHIAESTLPTFAEANEVTTEVEELKSFHARLNDELAELQEHSKQQQLRLTTLKELLTDILGNKEKASALQKEVEANLTPEECSDSGWDKYANRMGCVSDASIAIEENSEKYIPIEDIDNAILIYTSIKNDIQGSLQAVQETLASKIEAIGQESDVKSDNASASEHDDSRGDRIPPPSPPSRDQSFYDDSESDKTPPPARPQSVSIDGEIHLENPQKPIKPKPRFNWGTIIAELSGGLTGAVIGAGIGALIGFFLVPVTFGVSIPVFAAAGAAVGGAVGGLLIGGAAGTVVGNWYDGRQAKGEYPAAEVVSSNSNQKLSSTTVILKKAPKGKEKDDKPIANNTTESKANRESTHEFLYKLTRAIPNNEPATPKGRRGSMRIGV